MASERPTINRWCLAAFCLACAAFVCGVLGFALFNAELFQVYLALTAVTIVMLMVVRWWAGGPMKSYWTVPAIALTAGFLGLSVLLLPACGLINSADLRGQAYRSMKQIAGALLQYQDKHQHLPPAAILSADGKPLLSWRVAILPFLGEEELYRQFNLDEPWDSPWNRGLLKRMPDVYQTRATPLNPHLPNTTYFQALVGKGTAFEPGARLQIPRDFPDGAANTILIIEAWQPVPWTKPEDVPFDPDGPLPKLGGIVGGGGRFPWEGAEGMGGFQIALCHGDVRSVSRTIPELTLRRAIIRNDGCFDDLNRW